MIISNATPLIAFSRIGRLDLLRETGRKVAESLGLRLTGSVGILIRAKQLGEIRAIKPLLEHMVREGMYFSQRFLDAVLHQVGE